MILDTVSEILYRPSRGTIRKYTTLVELSLDSVVVILKILSRALLLSLPSTVL